MHVQCGRSFNIWGQIEVPQISGELIVLSLLDVDLLPGWYIYPTALVDLIENEDIDFGPWQLLHGEWLVVRDTGLRQRFPSLDLVPFARRLDSDDVACFDVSEESSSPKVKIIHDFASAGWEGRGSFGDFGAWLDSAKEAAEEWD